MLKEKIENYVTMKRAMGFKYRIQNSLLQLFLAFAEAREDDCTISQTVLEWAALAPSVAQRRNRLLTVRRFAIMMQAEDSQYEIPPANAFGGQSGKRRIPHIFSDEEVQRLLYAASQLKPEGTIRPKTYTTLFALLAVTGLRISEALALNIADLTDDGLMIRCTKFRKDRLVPLHQSTQRALEYYLAYRTRYTGSDETALFISNAGSKISYSTAFQLFLQLMRSIGLRGAPGTSGAHLHDLRHTFAVKSLEQCIGDYVAVSHHMTALSTYLGHAHISDTYWYLQATPRLLKQISMVQESCFQEFCYD